ncbi:MAG: hypothetical protein JEZ14_24035, partial [Marinilabiliaceae bacterium]|nr:hypothetical protein [Marinilabiliaceae bacterium]
DVVFIGEEAGFSNTTGDDNVFIGEDSGYNNTTASDNTFVGNQTGRSNTTGVRNTFLGNEAGWDNSTGHRNTFLGDSSGVDVGVGHHNTFIGQASGSNTEHADYNTFVGAYAGWDNNRTNELNNANYNTYLGYYTGFTNREGQYNVLIGAFTDFSSTAMGGNGSTNSYNIGIGYDALINGERVYAGVIGSNARVSSDNSFVIGGTTSVTRMSVGIGTDTPNQNASLELGENDKGFLISRMSSTEKTTFSNSLSSADEGMMVYDSTSTLLNIWNGTQWLSSGIQNLSLSSNTLLISDGNSVNLSGYMDNTDAQDLTLTGNTLAITNDGTTVDLSVYLDNTDAQNLSLEGASLSIANGNAVDLSVLQDGFESNTDEQTLSLIDNNLSITNGNSVDLSPILPNDEQNLYDANLSGSTLNISIENGNTVSVDLAPLLTEVLDSITNYHERISQLEADVAYLKSISTSSSSVFTQDSGAKLYQNIPNPSNGSTRIQFFIPQKIRKASIQIFNNNGVIYKNIDIAERGLEFVDVNTNDLHPGIYYYSLIIEGKNAGSKKLSVAK